MVIGAAIETLLDIQNVKSAAKTNELQLKTAPPRKKFGVYQKHSHQAQLVSHFQGMIRQSNLTITIARWRVKRSTLSDGSSMFLVFF